VASEVHKFQVGVFVIVATTIGIAALVWLGASRFFEDTEPFVTYFGESVQGLDPGASVKYRGVPAGRVGKIRIAPDGRLIQVEMDIDVEAGQALKRDPSLRASLELSGITGLRYVEIDRRFGDALNQAPTLSFEPPHQVIPSARSGIKEVQVALSELYDRVMQIDVRGLSADARAALQSATRLMSDERVDAMLTDLRSATGQATRLLQRLDTMTADVRLGPAVQNATEASAELKAVLAEWRSGQTGRQVNETLAQLQRLSESVAQVVTAMQFTLERLDRTAGSFQGLSEEVRSQPSRLLFSNPPAPRATPNGGVR